jgi:4-hydroxy 2-oxovalerate aldolase
VPAQVRRAVGQIAANTTSEVGVHFHNNLGLASANTLAAIDAGATWVDASLASMARGAGNLATEQAAAIFEAAGIAAPGVDPDHVARAADFVLAEVLDRPMRTSRNELLAGLNNHHYYFQEHINRIAAERDISARELGRRIGDARPKKVSHAFVAEVASAMTAEENTQ